MSMWTHRELNSSMVTGKEAENRHAAVGRWVDVAVEVSGGFLWFSQMS